MSDGKVLWERPRVDNVLKWSQHALALDSTGRHLATAGFSPTAFDLLVLDTGTGGVESQTSTRSVDALAFLDDGDALVVGGAEPNLRVWPADAGRTPLIDMSIEDDTKARKRTRTIAVR